jgi:hypothetical protein
VNEHPPSSKRAFFISLDSLPSDDAANSVQIHGGSARTLPKNEVSSCHGTWEALILTYRLPIQPTSQL